MRLTIALVAVALRDLVTKARVMSSSLELSMLSKRFFSRTIIPAPRKCVVQASCSN